MNRTNAGPGVILRTWRAVFATAYIIVTLPLLLVGSPVWDMDWFAGNGPYWWNWIRRDVRHGPLCPCRTCRDVDWFEGTPR